MLSLGVVAEYLGIAAKSAMGKPLYLIVSDPAEGPLSQATPAGERSQDGPAEHSPPVKPAAPGGR